MKSIAEAINSANKRRVDLGGKIPHEFVADRIKTVDVPDVVMPKTGWLGGKK